jgi:PAS domain S-box-containing protein
MTGSEANRGAVARSRDLRRVEHAVARILAETERPVEAYDAALEAIGRPLRWQLGAVWEFDPSEGRLHCVRTWHAGARADEFQALGETLALAPGEGLPGRVLATGEPAWLTDAPKDANFPRAEAARHSGWHAAFGFPLRSPRGVLGVMEFFSGEVRAPDARLLQTMGALGSQLGQFVARRRAEEDVRASESRLRAMLDATLDAVVTIDDRGRVLGWNQAAEAVFGYRASEAIGREMAELIVPPELRDAHRRGLARYLESEEPVVLDRRVELSGMRRDGSVFPVELTVTRIPLAGPPTFTGYLRDIADRVRADEELRASRARLVEVADAERKRIQRNLHDGAQQRLTGVLLMLGRLRASPSQADPRLDHAIDALAAGLDEIRELASGLHPSVLTERGLGAALEALALRTPVPVELETPVERRLPEPVESAAYYVVAEALANVQKHARARRVVVRATTDEHRIVVDVVDDGVGGADREGTGLRGLADRVEALGGRLAVDSAAGGGTRLRAEIPHGQRPCAVGAPVEPDDERCGAVRDRATVRSRPAR